MTQQLAVNIISGLFNFHAHNLHNAFHTIRKSHYQLIKQNYQYILPILYSYFKISPCFIRTVNFRLASKLTLSLLAVTFVICYYPLQTVWTRIRTDKMSVLIWIQTVCHQSVAERFFVNFKKKKNISMQRVNMKKMSHLQTKATDTYIVA